MSDIGPLLEKAERAFAVAGEILMSGSPDFAASRAYYGMFYVAEALLLSMDLRFSSHAQVVGQYGFHFARTTLLDPGHHKALRQAFAVRQLSDYDVHAEISVARVEEIIQAGHAFLADARAFLVDRT